MNVVDDFVRESILTYPGMFQSRTDVLHHALCVIGNGYKWMNGVPTSVFPYMEEKHWSPEEDMSFRPYDYTDDMEDVFKNRREKYFAEMQDVVDTVDERIHDRTFNDASFYPQSSYALILNIPEDIHPDWAEEVETMKELAEQNGWKF